VRIIDPAYVPYRPVTPKPLPELVVALLVGVACGIGGVFLRQSLDGASDPDEIEAATGVPVQVNIPRSAKQAALSRAARQHPDKVLPVLATVDSGDAAVESLRILRTSIKVAVAQSKSNIIAIGGPSPGVGKTFVSVNLAGLLAATGETVLLVDADLRRGLLHRHFGLPQGPGIAEVLSGEVPAFAACRETGLPNVFLLSAGAGTKHPAELLAGKAFQDLLTNLAGRFDLLVIDTPPILAVADAALIARCAGTNLLVLSAGKHGLKEISLAVQRWQQGGGRVSGLVLNDVRRVGGRYGRYGQYKRYEYRSRQQG
jgi:tyrosine-protein kinase Etk/Wzc